MRSVQTPSVEGVAMILNRRGADRLSARANGVKFLLHDPFFLQLARS
jgi:hypothetical protein